MNDPNGIDGADGLQSAPWPIKFIVRVGAPTALASVLLWYLLTGVTTSLSQIQNAQAELLRNHVTIVGNQARMIELLTHHAAEENRNLRMMQALCINGATDQIGRDRCLEAIR